MTTSSRPFYDIAYQFLRLSGIGISKSYLRERMEAHPHYPALNSLTDILDEFGIDNQALLISDKNRWAEIGFPFLALLNTTQGSREFRVIGSRQKSLFQKRLLPLWTGIALVPGDQRKIFHDAHNQQFRRESYHKITTWIILCLCFALITLTHLITFSIPLIIHYFLSVAGLLISCFIISYGLGIKSGISELFCRTETSGCNKVLNSRLGRFAGIFGLGDLSAIFFAASIIHLLISGGSDLHENILLLSILQMIAFLFVIISIGYQWKLGSWCKLCLTTSLIISAQAVNLLLTIPGYTPANLSFAIPPHLYLSFATSTAIAAIWILIKPLVLSGNSSIHQKIRIRKWRQDPAWFDALLPLHRRIEDSAWEREICYGNPAGVLQILVVSDPYCTFCAQAHMELDRILDNNPEEIGIRIRLRVKATDPGDDRYKAALSIFGAYEELVWKKGKGASDPLMRSIITDWFRKPELESWRLIYPITSSHTQALALHIEKSLAWCRAMQIQQTPAFFINGYEMPNPHTFRDLFLFASDYIQILRDKRERSAT